ncbi:hypothetical protein AYJ00_10875 [Shewanella algae]|nr:hypothetical protein AYJ00_10875 [Shewanella algae]
MPEIGKTSTVYLGDKMLFQATGYISESFTVDQLAEGSSTEISPAKFCRRAGGSDYWEAYGARQPVGIKDWQGNVTERGSTLIYKDHWLVCVPGTFSCYDSSDGEIQLTYKEKDICLNMNHFQRSISYHGRDGNILTFNYREQSGNIPRPAFDSTFTMDFSLSNTVRYRGARIEVIQATNDDITYRVLSNFDTDDF